jgi:uncharacterized protein (TIGR02996 family)
VVVTDVRPERVHVEQGRAGDTASVDRPRLAGEASRFMMDDKGGVTLRDEPTLLAAITADPDDDGPRIVYADWLLQAGDPRGELIAIQCALARGRTPELVARERSLLERYEAEWLAGAGLVSGESRLLRGFIERVDTTAARAALAIDRLVEQPCLREVRVAVDAGGNEAELLRIAERLHRRLPLTLEHVTIDRRLQWNAKHSDQVLRQGTRIELHIDEPVRAPAAVEVFEAMLAKHPQLAKIAVALCGRGRVEIDALIARLYATGPHPGVRSFEVRFVNPASRDWVQWIATRRLDDLTASFPELVSLMLPMAEIWLEELAHDRLQHLALSWLGGTPYGPSDSSVWGAGPAPRGSGLTFLRRSRLPALERLGVDFQYDWYVGWQPEDIAALCEATGLPRLAHLELRYSLLGNEICRMLPGAPFAAQLQTLDLTATEVSEAGARHLVERRAAFPRLERLICFPFDEVSAGTWAELAAAYPIELPS